jgi:hypothetical protein
VAACVLASRCVWYLLWYMVYCHHIVADTIWGACVHINRFESLTVRTKSWKVTTVRYGIRSYETTRPAGESSHTQTSTKLSPPLELSRNPLHLQCYRRRRNSSESGQCRKVADLVKILASPSQPLAPSQPPPLTTALTDRLASVQLQLKPPE